MVVAPPQYIRATPVITRVHQIDQPLAGRLLNGSLSGQFSRSGEARGSADVGGSPLSMFDGSIDSPRATRADCRSGLISRLPLLFASASKCEISRSLVKLIEPASNQTVEIDLARLRFTNRSMGAGPAMCSRIDLLRRDRPPGS